MLPVSIVTVTYNSARDWPWFAAAIRETVPAGMAELIVVDNASTDGTLEAIRTSCTGRTPLQVTESRENLGYCPAALLGAEAASGEHLVFVNPDTEPAGDWLGRMLHHAEAEDVGSVGPLSDYVAGDQQVHRHIGHLTASRAAPSLIAGWAAQVNGGRALETRLLIGFCLLVPRRVWDALGGFDQRLRIGHEDLEWSLRVRDVGLRLLVARDAFVAHTGHRSFAGLGKETEAAVLEESADGLRAILAERYPDGVPSARELWGMDWFETVRGNGSSEKGAVPDAPARTIDIHR